MSAPCHVQAVGLCCALGSGVDEVWPRLRGGAADRLTPREDLVKGMPRFFGQVPGALPEIPARLGRYACRNNRIALAAYRAIQPAVEEAVARYGAERVAMVLGSSTAGTAEAERAVSAWRHGGGLPRDFHLVQLEHGGLPEFLSALSGAAGPSYALSTACSTGAKTLASARSLLELGICDAVIAGAVDSLCEMTANGFHALQAMSAEVSNPMSRHRAGLTLGEGGALFLLTREEGDIALVGVGETSDAHHISAPDPAGRGAEASMRGALADAGVEAAEIAYLNLHGTGTPQNDAMESGAVARVFTPPPPCSSTKPLIGHTLGASGALEAAFCWLILHRREEGRIHLPPHRYDGAYDGNLPALDLAGDGRSVAVSAPAHVMSNSFGFGGSNCTLILRADA